MILCPTKKITNNKGFTFVEMLACVITLLLLAGVVSAGSDMAMKSYNNSLFQSDSQMLESTLDMYLCDMLRHANNVKTISDGAIFQTPGAKEVESFTNLSYNISEGIVEVSEEDGYIVYKNIDDEVVMLVGESLIPLGANQT